jgi:hypothetical protein
MSTEAPNHLEWLSRWYAAQCDGDWEHSYGVTIDTLDNPGWAVKIDLIGTPLEDAPFDAVVCNLDAPDDDPAVRWHSCKVAEKRFEGAGGADELATIIGVFREWAEEHEPAQ